MSRNCRKSASIGLVYCSSGCNAENLRNAFTFLPPEPTYTVEVSAATGRPCRMRYIVPSVSEVYLRAAEQAEVYLLRTRMGERIPVVWVRTRAPATTSGSSTASRVPDDQRPVILHFHDNATDIGLMLPVYSELSRHAGCEVLGVEYSGYGASSGTASARNALADAEAAFDFLVAFGVRPGGVVAYGQSVGSGPAVGLAMKRPLGGVILHSGVLSGIKVFDPSPEQCCRPSCVWCCFDFFPNQRRLKGITCPAFVIHGRNDDIVPIYHGVGLSEATPECWRWPGYFPEMAGHDDIVKLNAKEYYKEVFAFVRAVQYGCCEPMPLILFPRWHSQHKLGAPQQIQMADHTAQFILNKEPVVGP